MKYEARQLPRGLKGDELLEWLFEEFTQIEYALNNSASEDWVEIDGTGNPAFQNSWANFGAPHDTAAYYKDNWGRVHFKGVIASGTATAGTVMFTLPEEYRPYNTLVFATISNSALAEINVQSDGDVTIEVGSNVDLSLDGISFRAEQ